GPWRRTVGGVLVDLMLVAVGAGALWGMAGLRVVRQFERGVVLRFGRVQAEVRTPGLTRIHPGVDRFHRVNMQIVTMPVPAQDGITRDNVTVRVDAVVYFRVEDPVTAIVGVQDYLFAVGQVAQTSLRSIIGKSELDDLLSNREPLNQGLELLRCLENAPGATGPPPPARAEPAAGGPADAVEPPTVPPALGVARPDTGPDPVAGPRP